MSLIRGIKAAPLLFGARGREPADVEALAGALVRFGDLVAANAGRFASFELNPVRVLPAGQGLLVLDAALEPFEASC